MSFVLPTTLFAGTIGPVAEPRLQTGFFIGAGGSYNAVRMNANAIGTMNAVAGPPPLGLFSGGTDSYALSQQAFSPEVQVGYFQTLNQSAWLYGIEFLYQYSRIKKTSINHGTRLELINLPTNTVDELQSTGVRIKVDDELVLPVFIGHTFKNSFLYVGGGPSVFKIRYTQFPSTDELSGDYVGSINGFSNSQWIWGGAVQTGFAYYLAPTWFIKINYTYSVSGKNTMYRTRTFAPDVNDGLNEGVVAFKTSYRLNAYEAAISLNKVFNL
jgi:opacity protein-like surface antigen